MTREQIEKLIEETALRYAENHDTRDREAVARLTVKLAELSNVEIFTAAVGRCLDEDIRTSKVNQAVDFLESRVTLKRPFEEFRKALNIESAETRWQFLNASLSGIRQALGQ